jgi:uridine kinase
LNNATLAIGIAGGSGSGKSRLVEGLMAGGLSEKICVLEHDHYYKTAESMPSSIRESQNWDHPGALDNELFVAHLHELKRGKAIQRPSYDFSTHTRKPEGVIVAPRPILIVEGILILAVPEIRQALDWRFYMDAPDDERVLRRILRDTEQRGRTVQSVIAQYRSTTKVMHDEWIEPSRRFADAVIPSHSPDGLAKGIQLVEALASRVP